MAPSISGSLHPVPNLVVVAVLRDELFVVYACIMLVIYACKVERMS